MERSDAAGAAAAAEYFLDLYPYAMLTGDLAEWDRISARGCVFCAVFRSTVAHTYDVGGRFTGGALTHQPGTVLNQDPVIGGYLVEVHYEVSPGMELDADDEPVAPVLAETATAYVDTVYSYDGWTLVELGTDPRYALFGPPMHPISEVAPTQHAPGP